MRWSSDKRLFWTAGSWGVQAECGKHRYWYTNSEICWTERHGQRQARYNKNNINKTALFDRIVTCLCVPRVVCSSGWVWGVHDLFHPWRWEKDSSESLQDPRPRQERQGARLHVSVHTKHTKFSTSPERSGLLSLTFWQTRLSFNLTGLQQKHLLNPFRADHAL